VIVSGITGLTMIVDASGYQVNRPLTGLSAYGHAYRVLEGSGGEPPTLSVDGQRVTLGTSQTLEVEPFLGFNPDGTFPVVVRRETPVSGEAVEPSIDWLVDYFRPDGSAIGYARLPERRPWQEFNHELAMGNQGQVFDLVSLPDHSVELIQLGFEASPPEPLRLAPTPAATPLTRLQPGALPGEGAFPPGALEAESALLTFFGDLSRGGFQAANGLYAGTFDEFNASPPGADPAEVEAFWTQVCQQYLCLPIAGITAAAPDGPAAFTFEVVFMWPDGQRLEIGACCGGNPAAAPPVWQFSYPVARRDGGWKVLRGPLYVP
jgi:hypothetical protein